MALWSFFLPQSCNCWCVSRPRCVAFMTDIHHQHQSIYLLAQTSLSSFAHLLSLRRCSRITPRWFRDPIRPGRPPVPQLRVRSRAQDVVPTKDGDGGNSQTVGDGSVHDGRRGPKAIVCREQHSDVAVPPRPDIGGLDNPDVRVGSRSMIRGFVMSDAAAAVVGVCGCLRVW